jgi:hypothetical protein
MWGFLFGFFLCAVCGVTLRAALNKHNAKFRAGLSATIAHASAI